jgi:hypothetical protein
MEIWVVFSKRVEENIFHHYRGAVFASFSDIYIKEYEQRIETIL